MAIPSNIWLPQPNTWFYNTIEMMKRTPSKLIPKVLSPERPPKSYAIETTAASLAAIVAEILIALYQISISLPKPIPWTLPLACIAMVKPIPRMARVTANKADMPTFAVKGMVIRLRIKQHGLVRHVAMIAEKVNMENTILWTAKKSTSPSSWPSWQGILPAIRLTVVISEDRLTK